MKWFFPHVDRPSRWAAAFVDALFPTRCLHCRVLFRDVPVKGHRIEPAGGQGGDRREPALPFSDLMAPFLCPSCRADLEMVDEPFCVKCGHVFAAREGPSHLCGECIAKPRYYGIARSAGLYTGALRAAIHSLKYTGRVHLAKPLGRWMAGLLQRYWAPGEIDRVLPVPLHPRRLRKRGFNQAHLLACHLADPPGAGLRTEPIDRNMLVRLRETPPQTDLKKKERIRNVRGAFAVSGPQEVAGESVLLVDDVFTTGATVNECARVLLHAGALRVDVMTLARAAPHRVSFG